ncbi:MAG: M20/M25/M40 family metallo-hydrolase [Synergistaceae bacterium]|nr:M20/M25/M40 family metallo-hydrolase [Synergistaceae bacterium]
MKRYQNFDLYKLLVGMVKIPSVSPSREGENEIAEFIASKLHEQAYFLEHPNDLRLVPLENDALERHFVFAVVRAVPPTKKTVILLGHMDVVGVETFGVLDQWAFDPEEYTKKIAAADLPSDAASDLESGDWLFGRGVADMKSGLSVGLDLLFEASQHPERLRANIILLGVPDEENNSRGMLAAASYLAEITKQDGLEYLACIDLESTFAAGCDAKPSIYLGSLGKINVFFYCHGRETHIGEYYEGFSAAPVISRINTILEGNPKYADSLRGVSYPPYACIRQIDLRKDYSATIMTKAFAFYGCLTATKLPTQILAELGDVAHAALRAAAERCTDGGVRRWKPAVMTFEALLTLVKRKLGDAYPMFLERTLSAAGGDQDERVRAACLVDAMVEEAALASPTVVIGFLPPWYPPRVNLGETEDEKRMERIASEMVEETRALYGEAMEIRPLFEGVSDLSYCGFQGDIVELDLFARNMPCWGRPYSLPIEAFSELDIPILNMGPIGKDAHKNTERIHLPYAMEIYPRLLRTLVRKVAEK